MDALRKEEIYTIDDIYALPEGERAELIDGKIYYMAPPSTKHQAFVMNISYQIKDYMKRNNGDCQVFPAPFAVFLSENNINLEYLSCSKNELTSLDLTNNTKLERLYCDDIVTVVGYDGDRRAGDM